ncbi:MAG: alanine racemase [bacterium]
MNHIPRRVWLEISCDTLTQNYRKIAEAVAPAQVLAVLKANAYGLGGLPIAQVLAQAGASGFGVAEPYEALQLLPLGKPIQILSSILPEEIDPMVAAGVILPITDLATARRISESAVRQGKTATVHFKLDTGMGRLGILADEAPSMIRQAHKLPGLYGEGLFSHFPFAYESGSELTNRQMDLFCSILDELSRGGITFAKRHIANSDAINNFPRACRPPFNVVRTGINLHGSFDSAGKRALQVKPVLCLKTRLSAIRTLPAGTGIGYGHTCRLDRPTRIGTVSAGYADGLPLALSNRGYLLIQGLPCPVLGRLSMDYTTVSLERVPSAAVGDEVVCLGGAGVHALTVEDWATLKNTHPYEIICSFGNRVERRYV